MSGSRENADERTPLLQQTPLTLARNSKPAILPVVRHIGSQGSHDSHFSDLYPYSDTPEPESTRVAFNLVVLLHVFISEQTQGGTKGDIWDEWSQQKDAADTAGQLGHRILRIWTQFLETYRSAKDVEASLWTKFPMEEGSSLCVCVIDLLCDPQAPEALLSHPIIGLSISRTWKYGLCTDSPSATSTFEQLVHRFKSLSTPRAIHLVDLIGRTAFIIVLAQYLLYPPAIFYISLGTSAQGPREIFLTIMSAALLFRSPSIRTIPSLLVFLAFILTLPSVPAPGDSSFAILQMAFISHVVLFLHSSETPSPLFLCFIEQSLPMATLLLHGLTRVFFPIVLFYLPALVISTFLLSISLADTFFAGYTILSFQPTPVDTRFAFSFLFILELLLLIASLGMGAAMFHFSASSAKDLKGWDRYSKAIGLTARRNLFRAVRSYAAPYTFPPPLNLIHILAIRLPRVMLYLFGQENSVAYSAIGWMERWFWGGCVGTLAVLVSGLWLWGLV